MCHRPCRVLLLMGALVLVAFVLQGCETTSNRVIKQGFQSGEDRIKFLYEDATSKERGVLECRVGDQGHLSDCREVDLVFADEEGEER